ncbi:MAG TPA: sugar ABC transporter permease [Clostridiales bacterium]|nr:sugar ABC transporter permease [Clostridiales bacterium]
MSSSRTINIKKFFKRNSVPYLFLLPWLIGFLVLTAYPMFMSLYLSLTDYNISKYLSEAKFIGLGNYITMFTDDPKFIKSLQVTFTYVFVSVPLKLAFALIVAVIMNQKIRFVSFYRAVYYIPTLLGGSVAIAVLWKKLFSKGGVINGIIAAITGIDIKLIPGWISSPKYALWTLVLLTVWQFGSSMIIFLAGLKQIPAEYYEAGSIDGANKRQLFFHITVPSLSPVILFNLVMQMITAFQAFTQAYIISGGKGDPINSTLFYTLHLYNQGFYYKEMGYASAMAWLLLIIISAFTAIVLKTSGNWVNYGSGQ